MLRDVYRPPVTVRPGGRAVGGWRRCPGAGPLATAGSFWCPGTGWAGDGARRRGGLPRHGAGTALPGGHGADDATPARRPRSVRCTARGLHGRPAGWPRLSPRGPLPRAPPVSTGWLFQTTGGRPRPAPPSAPGADRSWRRAHVAPRHGRGEQSPPARGPRGAAEAHVAPRRPSSRRRGRPSPPHRPVTGAGRSPRRTPRSRGARPPRWPCRPSPSASPRRPRSPPSPGARRRRWGWRAG